MPAPPFQTWSRVVLGLEKGGMKNTEASTSRRLLRDWGREAGVPARLQAGLIVLSCAAAGLFAFCLARLIVQGPSAAILAGLAIAAPGRAISSQLLALAAAGHARRAKSLVRERCVALALARRRGEGPGAGETGALVIDEVEALDGYYARFAPAALEARLGPPAIALAVALASPVAAGLLLASLVPFVLFMALAGRAAGSAAERQFEALSRLSGHFVDRIRALPLILAYDGVGREQAQVASAAEDVANRTLSVLRRAFLSSAGLEFFAAAAIALVAIYCAFSLLGLLPFPSPERLDLARAFFALILAAEFYAPLRRLAGAYHDRQLGEAAARRIGDFLASATRASRSEAPAMEAPPQIRFEGAQIAYNDVRIGPLSGEAPAGRMTALVGPSGSGKSSYLGALLGLASLSEGAILIAGVPASAEASLAGKAAYAGQSPVFIPGTVIDNLLAVEPSADEADALSALRAVGLDAGLGRRAEAARTVLDERGSGLSGGERRRLALARALLRRSPVLLLDEPTADLDPAAEAELISLIRAASGERTVLVATHSEAVALAADHVLRLQ